MILGSYVIAMKQLEQVILSEPQLSDFVPTAKLLRRQAEDLEGGARHVESISVRPPIIPTRELAEKLLVAMAAVPEVHPAEETEEDLRLLSLFLGNLALGIAAAIHRDFPDVVPRTRG